jgi:hypothetical protein
MEAYTPEPAVDYISSRSEMQQNIGDQDGGVSGDSMKMTVQEEHGSACATATSKQTCLDALANLRAVKAESDCSFGMTGCYASYLAFTRGDEVGIVRTREETARFFGKVDTAAEAFALATFDGYYGSCSASPWATPATYRVVDGAIEIVVIKSQCNQKDERVVLRVMPDGTTSIVSTKTLDETGACAGRRPDGFRLRGPKASCDPTGAYLALVAELEEAAVHAFAIMAEELRAAGAPKQLIDAAERARADEIRHTKAMTRLARRHGTEPRSASVPVRRARSLVEMAVENAVEGCVREAYAALATLFQAERAEDPAVRGALRAIAVDEVAHAELSLRVDAWLATRLSGEDLAAVARARTDAIAVLQAELGTAPDPELRRRVGLPDAREARALLAAACSELPIAIAA